MIRFFVGALVLCLGQPALARQPLPMGLVDPRVQIVAYQRDQVVSISASPGYLVTIELAPDEAIQTVAVGDSAAWQVSASRGGHLLFVKALQAGADTNMTVVTSARFYTFDLTTSTTGLAAYQIRFRYPSVDAFTMPSPDARPTETVGLYHVRGSRALRPDRISDDGRKTYIEWSPDVPLPAIFFLDERGRETLANGHMRDGLFILDSVFQRLLFRIDEHTARAVRLPPDEVR